MALQDAGVMSFLNHLDVRHDKGHFFKLLSPLRYQSNAGEIYEVPVGFRTDFSSFFIKLGMPKAAALHDYLYTGKVSRKRADALMFEAMRDVGIPMIKARARYRAVRMFGWRNYKRGAK